MACTSHDIAPRGPVVEGVYVVAERLVSGTCDPATIEPASSPTHVELVYEGDNVMLYPCMRIERGVCFAFSDDKYAVGDLGRVIENGYEGEVWTYHAGTASCFAGFVDARLTSTGGQVHIADTRRGGIVRDLAPEACSPVNLPPPEELPCLWYEELALDPLP